jgi:carotenoid cleavage dioxygenase
MLFTPLDILWEHLIIKARDAQGKDKKPNPVLIQNFGPIRKQQNYKVSKVTSGKIPTDINGIYLRNGPDAKYIPDNKSHHWFDGDAMVHAMRIKDGELYYCNRWLESERFKMEREAD